MRVEKRNHTVESFSIIAIFAVCLTVACSHNPESKASVTESNNDSLYEYYEMTDTTSAEVAAWLERVSIDSAERLLSRHDGLVVLGDRKHKVWLRDILRCCPQKAMEYPFTELIDSLYYIIQDSKDGRLRLFSWNTGLGGTSPDIALDILLREDDGTAAYVDNNCAVGGLFFENHLLKSDEGETLYLFYLSSHEWGTYAFDAVELYRLNGHKLESTNYLSDYRLSVEYDIPCSDEGSMIDVDGNDIYIPIFEYDEYYQKSVHHDRYLHYRWNGHGLDSLGNTGNRHLHPSLREYKAFKESFATKSFNIRVDEMNDGSFRYASWNRYKELADKPNLIVYGGSYDKEKKCFVFETNGYMYMIGKIPERYRNEYTIDNGITVIKDGLVILCQREEEIIIE